MVFERLQAVLDLVPDCQLWLRKAVSISCMEVASRPPHAETTAMCPDLQRPSTCCLNLASKSAHYACPPPASLCCASAKPSARCNC